jgi:hypothetical protein
MNGPEHPGEVALADEFHGLPARSQEMPSEIEALMSQWWGYARNTGSALRAGNPPPRVDVWGPILEPDEQGRLQAEMSYSRFYGTDSSYRHNNLFVFGKTDFVLGAMGVNALMNQYRKTEAQRRAGVQWREHQIAPVVVTSKRLLCGVASGRWLTFPFSQVSEFFPEIHEWSVTLGFAGSTWPLRLTGPAAPGIALWIAYGVLGPRWVQDPRLQQLQ